MPISIYSEENTYYIILASEEGNGAGRAYGPFEHRIVAEHLVEQITVERDKLHEGWQDHSWLDVLEIRPPQDLE